MEIKTSFLSAPRENSGSRSSNRFDYQKNWALCHLLDLHQNKTDYLLILDLHEDVVVLDSSENPEKATFFQVKTNGKGCWELGLILKKYKTNSYLGKLYYNKLKFKDNVQKLVFISNAYYKVKLSDQSKKAINQRSICISEMAQEEKDKIIDKLSKEFGIRPNQIEENIIFLERSNLAINSHSETTKGKLSEFLEKTIPGCKYKLGLVYRTLFDEIRKKSNEELDCNTFEELVKYKSISKNGFDSILKIIFSSFSENSWDEVSQSIIREDFPLSERQQIKSGWNKYSIERMDCNNLTLQAFRKKILKIIKDIKKENIENCRELLETVKEKLGNLREEYVILYKDCLDSMILMEYFSYEK